MNLFTKVGLHTGRKMPVMGVGTWQLTKDTEGTIQKAIELGYRLIDTSGDYGTQPGIAEAIQRCGVDRSELFVVTKVEETDDAYEAVGRNILDLDLDYADLVLIHRPPKQSAGESLWEGLVQAKTDGLAIDIGVSNYPIKHIETLMQSSPETPVVNQIEWSPFGHSQEMLAFCEANDIVVQAYSPLTRTKRLDDPTLMRIAEKYGKTPAQILIRWNLQVGSVPLPKANRLAHLKENIDVFDFELNVHDITELNALNEGFSSLGSLPYL